LKASAVKTRAQRAIAKAEAFIDVVNRSADGLGSSMVELKPMGMRADIRRNSGFSAAMSMSAAFFDDSRFRRNARWNFLL